MLNDQKVSTFLSWMISHDGSMVLRYIRYMVCHGSHQYTPVMLACIYQHQPDPSWVLDRHGTCSPCRCATCRRHGPRRVGSSPSMAPGMNGRGVGIPCGRTRWMKWWKIGDWPKKHMDFTNKNMDLTVTHLWLHQQNMGLTKLNQQKMGI